MARRPQEMSPGGKVESHLPDYVFLVLGIVARGYWRITDGRAVYFGLQALSSIYGTVTSESCA
jgi:hypothetical protein